MQFLHFCCLRERERTPVCVVVVFASIWFVRLHVCLYLCISESFFLFYLFNFLLLLLLLLCCLWHTHQHTLSVLVEIVCWLISCCWFFFHSRTQPHAHHTVAYKRHATETRIFTLVSSVARLEFQFRLTIVSNTMCYKIFYLTDTESALSYGMFAHTEIEREREGTIWTVMFGGAPCELAATA